MAKRRTDSILKQKYFHGIGTLVAKQTGYSQNYVIDVLNEKFPNRNTESVQEIKAVAEQFKVA